jgi:hypothetical protein
VTNSTNKNPGELLATFDRIVARHAAGGPEPSWQQWSFNLRNALDELAYEAGRQDEARQLAEIRAVLDAFDWEHDDRQYALERIDQITEGEK